MCINKQQLKLLKLRNTQKVNYYKRVNKCCLEGVEIGLLMIAVF